MDFTSQHFMELIQDPIVLALVIAGLLLGVVLGRMGSRRTARTPQNMDSRRNNTPPRQAVGAAGHGSGSGSSVQDSTPKPSVPETQRTAPGLPDPAQVKPANAPAVVVVKSPEPVRPQASLPRAADPEPSANPKIEAKIHTRTGTNPSKMKLVDPHAESERVWSEEETARAVALYRSGKAMVPIALAMKIDQRQVTIRLIRVLFSFDGELEDLKAAPRHGKKYSDEEVSKMRSYFDAGVPIKDIAMAVERTVLGVGWRMLEHRMI